MGLGPASSDSQRLPPTAAYPLTQESPHSTPNDAGRELVAYGRRGTLALTQRPCLRDVTG